MSESENDRQQLATRVVAASLSAAANLASPDAGAAATALEPLTEALVSRIITGLNRRRVDHASETLTDAAEAARETLEEFVQKALADDRHSELLARTLFIAQDTALRQKRLALGRALAAGVVGDEARVDEELIFIRAVADIDTPHIRVLGLLASPRELTADVRQAWWSPAALAETGIGEAVLSILATLELHGLIQLGQGSSPWRATDASYNVTASGHEFLRRLKEDADSQSEPSHQTR